MQTQTSSGKDRPSMLAPGNYHPPYKFKWAERTILVVEGSLETTTEWYIENYKNVLEDIRNLLNAEAEAVHIILTGIDNDIYSIVDACLNAMEMWKAIKRINRGTGYDNPRINRGTGYDNQREVNTVGARENVADLKDDTDDEPEDQELEAHYLYMAQIQEVIPYAADNSGPIFDTKPLQKVQPNNDEYNVFANERQHPEQPKFIDDTYLNEQGDTNVTSDSMDVSTNGEEADQDDGDYARECDLLASLIDKLKCEIDDNKNCNNLQNRFKYLVRRLGMRCLTPAELEALAN
ncbi:hypothetical protein Tco_0688421, partial [Tanacetum coccineum]